MRKFFDAHTHAQFAAFKEDMDEVIRRALDNDVWMINVGTQIDTSRKAVEVANQYPEGVYAPVGLHPIHTDKSYHDSQELGSSNLGEAGPPAGEAGFTSRGEEFDYEAYKKLAQDAKVVAIGECGFDFYRLTENTKKLQREAFERQIELAGDAGKPLMIHCRQAYEDLLEILRADRNKLVSGSPGVVHFFSGSKEQAGKLLEMGFAFSFGGASTFPEKLGKYSYREMIEYIPLKQMVLETDAPYVTPEPHRGKRNEPLYVKYVAERVAVIKGVSVSEVRDVTTRNTINIFRISN